MLVQEFQRDTDPSLSVTGGRSHAVFSCSPSVRSMDQQDESQRDLHNKVEGRINRVLPWWPGVSVREGRRLAPVAWDAAYLRFKLITVALIHRR